MTILSCVNASRLILDRSLPSWARAQISGLCDNPRKKQITKWPFLNYRCPIGHNKMVQQTSWPAIYICTFVMKTLAVLSLYSSSSYSYSSDKYSSLDQYSTDVLYVRTISQCIWIRPNTSPRESITTKPTKMPFGQIN